MRNDTPGDWILAIIIGVLVAGILFYGLSGGFR